MSKESQRTFCFMIGPWGDLVRVMMVLLGRSPTS